MKYLLFCTISLLSLAACIREDVPSADGFALAEGDPLPEFSISNPYGTVSKKDLENKFALIIFFSTTCSDCRKAFPDIYALYNVYKNDPSVRVLLIARSETEEQVAAYFREQQYDMEFFADPDRKTYSLFADNTIPRVFLAGKDGMLILTQTEKVDAEEIKAAIPNLLTGLTSKSDTNLQISNSVRAINSIHSTTTTSIIMPTKIITSGPMRQHMTRVGTMDFAFFAIAFNKRKISNYFLNSTAEIG